MSIRNTYPIKVRRQVDRALARNASPGEVAKKLGLPRSYIASRKQAIKNREAIAALKQAQVQAVQQGGTIE